VVEEDKENLRPERSVRVKPLYIGERVGHGGVELNKAAVKKLTTPGKSPTTIGK
jgi:hypothetical protein